MFISPIEIIQNLDLKEGMKVADCGSGTGAYVFPISGIVGAGGKVYAIDKDINILDKINREAEKGKIENIDTILGNLEEKIPIPEEECDFIILSNVLSEVHNLERVILEIKRILKDNGQVLIIDWKNNNLGLNIKRRGLIEEEKLVAILANNNLEIKKHIPAGDYHYAFLVEKF